MADLTVVNPNVLAGVAPVSNTLAGGGDRFAVTKGRKYMIRVDNAHTSSQNVVIDDPNSQNPGAATSFNPDVTLTVPNATKRAMIVDADRFGDANNWVNLTYSGVTAMTMEIYGPMP